VFALITCSFEETQSTNRLTGAGGMRGARNENRAGFHSALRLYHFFYTPSNALSIPSAYFAPAVEVRGPRTRSVSASKM
jgi:hypothetical protein